MSEGEYQAGQVDPLPADGPTIGELARMIERFGIVALRGAFLVAELDENGGARAPAYKACWLALGKYAEAEVGR